MSTAIAGLIGVAVGALVTGSVQALTAWLERRRQARTAARLIYSALTSAGVSLRTIERAGKWLDVRPFNPAWEEWEKRREAVAVALASWQWHAVTGAFDALEYYEELRAGAVRESDPARAYSLAQPGLEEDVVRVDRALTLLWAASAGALTRRRTIAKLRREGVHKLHAPLRLSELPE